MKTTILFLSANPTETMRLNLDKEFREIDEGLYRVKNRDNFSLQQKWAVRTKDIRRAMLEFRPSIVHFSGHGMGAEGIAFEDEAGKARLVGAEALAGFFALFADSVECVLLNACFSESQAQAIAQHINYVIGMKTEIDDSVAIEFAVAFYDALGSEESIEFAYKLACNTIQWANVPKQQVPVLIKRQQNKKENRLYERDVAEVSIPSAKPELVVNDNTDKYVKAQKQVVIFTEQLALLQQLEKLLRFNSSGDLTSRFGFYQMLDVNAWKMFKEYAEIQFGVMLPTNEKFDIPCPVANIHPDTLVYVPDPTIEEMHNKHDEQSKPEREWDDYFHFVIDLPEVHFVAVSTIEYFLQSTLLPHRFTPLLHQFMEVIGENTEAIRTTMNACALMLPTAYPDVQSLENFDTFRLWIWNKYNRHYKRPEDSALEILRTIKEYLGVD